MLALERAQVRAVAAMGYEAPELAVTVSRLKIRMLGLASAVLRFVATLLKRRPGG